MKLVIGSDHAGYHLKVAMGEFLKSLGHEVLDVGAFDEKPSDYPDFAEKVGAAILDGRGERGVLICGSGVGVSVAANKIPGIRAALIHDHFSARQGVEDDHINIICVGGRTLGPAVAWDLIQTFLAAEFSQAGRHLRRLAKVASQESKERADEYHPDR